MQDTIMAVVSDGRVNAKLPLMSVAVPEDVPAAMTLAPMIGSDVALTTDPVIFLLWPNAVWERVSAATRIRRKRFLRKNLFFNFIMSIIALGKNTIPYHTQV